MDIFTSTLVTNSINADLVDEQATGTVYLGWLKPGHTETSIEVRICKIEKTAITGGVTYYTKWAGGNKQFSHNWANRAALTYQFFK